MSPETAVKTQHTPTPWNVDERSIYCEKWGMDRIALLEQASHRMSMSEVKANAAFIVRAVNAHEELLRIAKQMVFDWKHNEPKMPVGYINDVLQAIAKAEGK